MSMFSDDPTLPVGVLLLVAAGCFVLLRARQEGKYLVWGLAALGLAALTAGVEWLWVTDEERIERVVYDLRDSLLASDADGVLAHLTPDVQYVHSGESMPAIATRTLIKTSVANSQFDIVRLRGLQASAGRQTRRGKAEFKVFVRGTVTGPFGGSGAADTSWSLGFQETKPGVWKVNRITPVSLPYNAAVLAGALGRMSGGGAAAAGEPGSIELGGPGPGPPLPGSGDYSSRRRRFRMDRKSMGRMHDHGPAAVPAAPAPVGP